MQSSSTRPTAPQNGENFRVLVVEDEPAVAKLLVGTLGAVKLDCAHAPNGVAAIELFQRVKPHLVLLDLGLPLLGGDQVCAKIRESSTVPIIMLTAQAADDQQVQGFKMGADDYIAKPFNPKLLVARVVAALRRAYRYDVCDDSSGNDSGRATKPAQASTPAGWAQCGRCDYMGPRDKFEYETAAGRRGMRCPVCNDTEHIIHSLS